MMPNFLIIGAMKAGTSSLYAYLGQHPQIYMSHIKESRFFASEGENMGFCGPGDELQNKRSITHIRDYSALFRNVSDEIAIGEASPMYIDSPKAAERIQHYIPDVKLIAMLRNPVERAYSNFLHAVRENREPLNDFARALGEEESRKRNNWSPFWRYKERGLYYIHLKRFFERFDRNQIRIYLYDDWQMDNIRILQDIFRFLNVDHTFVPDVNVKHNVTGIPRIRALHRLVCKPNPVRSMLRPFLPIRLRQWIFTEVQNLNLSRPTMDSEVRKQLAQSFLEDILKLQDLIERDLSAWLKT
ncbi:MAG: sulfotransferase [Bacteroidota bacterium]